MPRTTDNPLVLRLRQCAVLSDEDERCLQEMTRDVRSVPADVDLKSHGEKPGTVHIMMEGLACRYKVLPDGRRQIMAFMVPGDPCDLKVALLKQMDHGICTLAPSFVAHVPHATIEQIAERRPSIARAFWCSTLLDGAILREWLVNIGRRDAFERVAHLLWELFLRHAIVGRVEGTTFALPLTQSELADALGLSNVHINRTMQRLRAEELIESDGHRIVILQPTRLRQVCGFECDYLHLDENDRSFLGVANL